MGGMGPKRVLLKDNGDMPPPPYRLVDNEETWLDFTDLVFIDPVGTGYSRAKTADAAKRMNGIQGDLQSVGEFIRMYITRNNRWASPLFLAGLQAAVGIPFASTSPPATPLLVWAALYVVAGVAGAMLCFAQRDL